MASEPIDPGGFLWNDLDRLTGVSGCRLWWWTTMGIPGYVVWARRHNFAILTTEAEVRQTRRVGQILRLIEGELCLLPETWRSQGQFFDVLFKHFFPNENGPAWIKVHAARKSFARRVTPPKGKALQSGQIGSDRLPIAWLSRGSIPINNVHVPANGLRLFHHWGVPDKRLHLQRVHIHRLVGADAYGGPIRGSERWLVPVSGDDADRAAVAQGINPSLAEFFRPDSGIQTSPLISLCRLERCTRKVQHCVFSLHPGSGEVVDFRETDYTAEFYFRSDPTCVTMLEKLTTPGCYDML